MDTNLLVLLLALVSIFSIVVILNVVKKYDAKWEDKEYDKAFKRLGLYQQGYDEDEGDVEKVKNDELYIQDTQQFLNNAKVVEDTQYVRFSDFLKGDDEPEYDDVEMPEIEDAPEIRPLSIDIEEDWQNIFRIQNERREILERERVRQAQISNENPIGDRDLDEWLDDVKRQAVYSRQRIPTLTIFNAIEEMVNTSKFFQAKKLASEQLTGIEYEAAFKYINEAARIINKLSEDRQDELVMARDLFSSNLISQEQAQKMLNNNSLKSKIEAHPILKILALEFRNTLENRQSTNVQGASFYSYSNHADWASYNAQLVNSNPLQNAISSNMKTILFPEDNFDNRYFMSVASRAEGLIKVLCENALLEELRTMGANRWAAKEKYGVEPTAKPEMVILMKPQMGALIASNYLMKSRYNYYVTVSKDRYMSEKDYQQASLKSVQTNQILKSFSGNIMEIYDIKSPKYQKSAFRKLSDSPASFYIVANPEASTYSGQIDAAFVLYNSFYFYKNTIHQLVFEVPKTIYNVPVKYYTDNNNWSSIYPIIVIVKQHNGNFKGYGFNRDLKSFCSFDMDNISEEIVTDNVPDDALDNPFMFPVYANVPFSINPHSVQIITN